MAKPKLTVVIPVYNERGTVMTVLEKVKALPVSKEIIVIDNLSTDGTRELLETVSDPEIRVVLQSKNLGKGTSVKLGFAMAKGEWVIIQDADLEYEPSDILRLLEHAEKAGEVAVFWFEAFDWQPARHVGFLHRASCAQPHF